MIFVPCQLVRARLNGHTRAVETQRKQSTLSLHPSKARLEFDFAKGEGVASVESSVHVRIGHAAKELGVVFSKDIAVFSGVFFKRGRVGLECTVFSPLLLVLFFNSNQGIALLGLFRAWYQRHSSAAS